MSFRNDLHEYLRDTFNLPTTPVRLSQRPMSPSLGYLTISATEPADHSGRFGLVTRRVQIDVWAGNDAEVDDKANEIRRTLNGYRGSIGDTEVASVFFAGERDLSEKDIKQYRRSMDFLFTEREAA